ncbi:hypothetical protein J2Y56_005713, partial [Pseudomonas sp. BE134]|nr:hypothetical protein [Pseudomonas sp. BE134]
TSAPNSKSYNKALQETDRLRFLRQIDRPLLAAFCLS